MDKDKFGKLICELRKDKGMTQQELGDKLHLTNKAISKWERGLSLHDICLLEKISDVLDITVMELLKGEKNIDVCISNEEANMIIEDTLKHSGDTLKKIKKKLAVSLGIIIGIFPLLLILICSISFFLIKNEKSLDDALMTFVFIIIASIVVLLSFGIPILGITFTYIFYKSNLLINSKQTKNIVCIFTSMFFLIWLLRFVIRVFNNILKYGV